MDIKIGADGENSCRVTLSGEIAKAATLPVSVLSFDKLVQRRPIRGLRLDAMTFAVQEKMGFNLWWECRPEAKIPKYKLIMPIESRGFFDFEKITPIESPSDAVGVALTAFKVTEPSMTFLLMFDFTKLY